MAANSPLDSPPSARYIALMTENQNPLPPQGPPEGSAIGGKIIVALIPFCMVTAYFMMQSGGVLFQRAVIVPYLITLVVVMGGFIGFVALLAKLEEKPKTRQMVTAFFMTLLVIMALVVFKLNGLF